MNLIMAFSNRMKDAFFYYIEKQNGLIRRIETRPKSLQIDWEIIVGFIEAVSDERAENGVQSTREWLKNTKFSDSECPDTYALEY